MATKGAPAKKKVARTRHSGAKARPLTIVAEDGRKLPSGVVARWPSS